MWALQAVIDRAQTPSNISFVMAALVDHYRMNIINAGHFVVSQLRDYRNSYVEILKVKKSVRDELLTEWLPRESGIDVAVVAQIAKVFSPFENVRKYQTAYPGALDPDLSWQLGLGQSAARAVTMIEGLVYGSVYDRRFKDAVSSKKTEVADALDYPPIQSCIEEIKKLAREEKIPEGARDVEAGSAAEGAAGSAAGGAAVSAAAAAAADEGAPDAKFDALPSLEKENWMKHIKKTVAAHVQFISDQKTANLLEAALKERPTAMLRGDPTGLVIYHFDVKKFGEPATQPDKRSPPLRDSYYHRLVRAVLDSRKTNADAPGALGPGEVAVLLDGGKSGLKQRLLNPWKEGARAAGHKRKADCQAEGGEDDDEEQNPDVGDDDDEGAGG